jgi:hypothetical protein
MTAHTEFRSARYAFALAVALFGALVVGGPILGSTIWPRGAAAATTTSSRIDVDALMSKVDTAEMPALEIADLF